MQLGTQYRAFNKAVPSGVCPHAYGAFPYAYFDGSGLVTTNGHYLSRAIYVRAATTQDDADASLVPVAVPK